MRTEILAGITTFITVAYILILNPQILADPFVITGDVAMAAKVSNGVFIGTCIGAFIGTFLCAVYDKVPLAQAPANFTGAAGFQIAQSYCDHSGGPSPGDHPGHTGTY